MADKEQSETEAQQQETHEETHEETSVRVGMRRQIQDHSLALYSQQDVRERLLAAMNDVLDLGFGCDLLARPIRNAVEFRLRISTDGKGEKPVRTLQAIADRHSLDLQVSFQEAGHTELILYPRA